MHGPRIYSPQPLIPQHSYPLDDNHFAHLIRVLRLTTGDALRVFNGQGLEYAARLVEVHKKSASFAVTELLRQEAKPKLHLHLGQVMSKGDRMDFTIQKATELGVSDITPLWSERCDVRLKGERLDKKLEHWQNVAISACQQSGRCWVPNIHPPEHFLDWAKASQQDIRLMLHPHQQQPLSEHTPPASVALLIGPEGGFTELEVEQALNERFTGLRLGPRILRTETASLTALSILQFLWGDLAQ